MNTFELVNLLNENADQEQAAKMSAYMKDNFTFWGIPKPKLEKLVKPFISEHRKSPLDWNIVFSLWDCKFREAQYTAITYLDTHVKELQSTDIKRIEKLITTKSWWETVDSLDEYVGIITLKDNSIKEKLLDWSVSDNIWLRRVSIDAQQRYKEETDIELLTKVIENNLGSTEFFINKAIGWSLREYSKVNPQWVTKFIEEHKDKLDKLSIKEAGKYL